jgi:hypothetical protein
MSTANKDVETLEAMLKTMGDRAATDPEYREQLIANHVSELAAAGVSALSLTESLVEANATEADVQAYNFEPMSFQALSRPQDPVPLILSHTCIGTCTGPTLWACGGCSNSFKAP